MELVSSQGNATTECKYRWRANKPRRSAAKTSPFSTTLRPHWPPTPLHSKRRKLCPCRPGNRPRRLNRYAGFDDPTFPKAATSCHPQKAPCFARHIAMKPILARAKSLRWAHFCGCAFF
jgi:hypothetical protein